jgi:hypothetical protein
VRVDGVASAILRAVVQKQLAERQALEALGERLAWIAHG